MSKLKRMWINQPATSNGSNGSDILAKLHGVNVLYDASTNAIAPTGYKVKHIARIVLNVPGHTVLSSGWLRD